MIPWIGDTLISPDGEEFKVTDVWISADDGPLVVLSDGRRLGYEWFFHQSDEWSIRR